MRSVLAKYRALKRRLLRLQRRAAEHRAAVVRLVRCLLRLQRRAAEHRAAVRLVRCATTDDINSALEVVYARHNVPVDFLRGSHKKGQWMPGEIKMMEQILAMAEKHDERVRRIAGYKPDRDDNGAPGGMGERKGLFTE